ncbi:MAG: nucleoside diphosphate kinase regulator [Amaricoccus sp.]|uniref:nucleoside diphosphate kinase regulator n=1 Tax=Amaricoccus sp. TaxID=1872485 RepID=UPI0039E233E0
MSTVPVQDPPIVLDAAWSDRLEELAAVASRRGLAAVGDRLMAEVARATVLPTAEMPADVVNIGSTVRYRDETTGREHTVTLVLPPDVDIDRGRISVLTPVGAALIGLRSGAGIGWETREGEARRLTVLSVAPAA